MSAAFSIGLYISFFVIFLILPAASFLIGLIYIFFGKK